MFISALIGKGTSREFFECTTAACPTSVDGETSWGGCRMNPSPGGTLCVLPLTPCLLHRLSVSQQRRPLVAKILATGFQQAYLPHFGGPLKGYLGRSHSAASPGRSCQLDSYQEVKQGPWRSQCSYGFLFLATPWFYPPSRQARGAFSRWQAGHPMLWIHVYSASLLLFHSIQ